MIGIYCEISKENLARGVELQTWLRPEAEDLAAQIRKDSFTKASCLYHGDKDFTDLAFSNEPLKINPPPTKYCGGMIAHIVDHLSYSDAYPLLKSFAKEKNFPMRLG